MELIFGVLILAIAAWIFTALGSADSIGKGSGSIAERAAKAALQHANRKGDGTVATKSAKGHNIPVRTYSVPLVGESNYQDAIEDCEVDDQIDLIHEPDNPYDSEAIAAVTKRGKTIGYLGRSSWLKEALLDEGQDCLATIDKIETGPKGLSGVVLSVALIEGEIATRKYRP